MHVLYDVRTLLACVFVKCNQNGKESLVKTKYLTTKSNGPLKESDLVKGSQLLLTHKEKTYPVTFLYKVKG